MNESLTVLAWTLIHFVWQGTGIGAAAAVLLAALHRRGPALRYSIAVIALGSMLATPIVTAGVLRLAALPVTVRSTAPLSPVVFNNMRRPSEWNVGRIAPAVADTATPQVPASLLRWIVAVWVSGVVLLIVRLTLGLRTVSVWRSQAQQSPRSPWQGMVDALTDRWGVRRVRTVLCDYVPVPMLIGYFRPLILLPAALLASLTPAQIEAILVHELAHLRRHDAVVNAFQLCVETLFFYHPAVWWLSARIRDERELCCDAAVAASCDRASYAEALLKLGRFRKAYPSMTMRAADGSLLRRVQRLLGETPDVRPMPVLVAMGAVLALLAIPPMVRAIAAPSVGAVDDSMLTGRPASAYVPLPDVSVARLTIEYQSPGRRDAQGQSHEKGDAMSNQAATFIGGLAVASILAAPAAAQPANGNGYALVIARSDGALGPYLHRANLDCATLRLTMTAPPSRENLPCNLRRDIGRVSASGLPFDQLVGMLREHTHFWIEDRTGLSGDFDWDLAWTPENLRATAAERFPRIDPNGQSIFDALESQLGLRLVPLVAQSQPPARGQVQDPEGRLHAAVDALVRSWQAGDADAWSRAVDDNATIQHTNGDVHVKRDEVEHIRSGTSTMSPRIDSNEQLRFLARGDTVIRYYTAESGQVSEMWRRLASGDWLLVLHNEGWGQQPVLKGLVAADQ